MWIKPVRVGIVIALVMFVSGTCIAVGDVGSRHDTLNRSDETILGFYDNATIHTLHPHHFDYEFFRDDFNREKIRDSTEENLSKYPVFDGNVSVSSNMIYVPDDYLKIQWAVDNATAGNTVIVKSGIYYKNVNVNKQLILRGVDTGSGKPVVDAGGSGSAITLSADGITLEGFTVTDSESSWGDAGIKVISSYNNITGNSVSNNNYGIFLDSSNNNTITGNNVSNKGDGIFLDSSNNNTITGNNVSNNEDGIFLDSSNNNTITGNNANNNYFSGISLIDSSNNTITDNTFVNDGLFVEYSYQNIVEDNIVNGKPLIYLEDTSDIVATDAGQVILVNCNNITVENRDLSNTMVGIELWKTEDSRISNNTVRNNHIDGIYISYSSNNTITDNNASNNNGGGISISYSCNNIITGNTANNNCDGISLFVSCNNNTITGNNVSNNKHGISLYYSCDRNIITGNTANNNCDGISLRLSSNNNTITGNNVRNNSVHGHLPLLFLQQQNLSKQFHKERR